jgi:hypothetical protein
METNINFWSYLAHFFLEKETFQIRVVEKIKIHLCFFFFRKSFRLWDNVEKYCIAVQATDGNMNTRIACWITKATDTYWEYVILISFHCNNGY